MIPSERPFFSIVVPAYGQAETICGELERLDAFLARLVPSHEMILVIDGNDDDTLGVVTRTLSLPRLRVECFEDNQGKGAAVRHGLLHSRGDLVAFMDSGGDLNLDALRILLLEQQLHTADIVIGSKRHSLSHVMYPRIRRLYSWVYQMMNRLLFRLRVRDTQVGMKLFRREVLQDILPRLLVKRFAFDLELLVVATHRGFRRIVEAPIELQYQFSSSIQFRSVMETFWDTLAIFYRLRVLHWYDQKSEEAFQPSSTGQSEAQKIPTPILQENVRREI